jgi:hypothetical protein
MNKALVPEQFGKNAAGYLTSSPHALGKSLERLVALTSPQKSWRALDIATGGGHVAYAFAPMSSACGRPTSPRKCSTW